MLSLKKEAILICCVALTLFGCATSSQDKKRAMEAYNQALQDTDPHKTEILQPESEKEQAAIERFTYLLAHFTEDTIKQYARDVYAPNAYYRDSFTAKQGVENIETYFIEGARTMHELAFDLQDVAVHDGNYYFRWITQVSLLGKEEDVIHLTGVSHVRFDKEGRVIFEQDFWDAGVIYERLPVIGSFIRWLKKKA
ncbi:MAG: nuclear transport factor 2 family protein [Deltaproteobacteria bacterium]|nr:nuclear transport factor 2 family protein [Deltaproteobacteria bacterium]